jgi:hypothetical protein
LNHHPPHQNLYVVDVVQIILTFQIFSLLGSDQEQTLLITNCENVKLLTQIFQVKLSIDSCVIFDIITETQKKVILFQLNPVKFITFF